MIDGIALAHAKSKGARVPSESNTRQQCHLTFLTACHSHVKSASVPVKSVNSLPFPSCP